MFQTLSLFKQFLITLLAHPKCRKSYDDIYYLIGTFIFYRQFMINLWNCKLGCKTSTNSVNKLKYFWSLVKHLPLFSLIVGEMSFCINGRLKIDHIKKWVDNITIVVIIVVPCQECNCNSWKKSSLILR